MGKERVERKLTAILFADVVGYSRLMEHDETNTLANLKAHRENLINPTIAEHQGRIVKLMGDGVLVDFASVVDAMTCAIAIQQGMSKFNKNIAPDHSIELRIGIHLGDIIVEGEDMYGDGVNVASRLEGLADPGGICLSRQAYDQVETKLDLSVEDLGLQQVKNIRRPIRAFKVRIGHDILPPLNAAIKGIPNLSDKPSIAVLPFVNMSSDSKQEFFADGITEDIITTLSRILGLFVIDRTSTFTYKGRAIELQQVSRDLGVRYVLEGSVRTDRNRVRVTAQLVNVSNGSHLWADRFDRDLTDVFAVQDEITINVTKALQVALVEGEQARVWHRATNNVEAWSCLSRAVVHFHNLTRGENQRARKLIEDASQLDPNYATAWVWLGHTYWRDVRFQWASAPDESLAKAAECAESALSLGDDYSELHALLGDIHLIRGEFDAAIESGERALALNPNGAYVNALLGATLNWAGRPEEALIFARKAMQFSPLHPSFYEGVAAHANRLLGRYEEAVVLYQRSIEGTPEYISPNIGLTACYAAMDRLADARAQAAQVLRLDPNFSVARWYAQPLTLIYRLPEHAQRTIDALLEAGLPE